MTPPDPTVTPERLPSMSDGDLRQLRGWLRKETRAAQRLLALVEREQKQRRRRAKGRA